MAMGGGGGEEGILMDTILFVTAYRTGIHQHPYVYNVCKVLKSSTQISAHLSVLRRVSVSKRASYNKDKLFVFHLRICIVLHTNNL